MKRQVTTAPVPSQTFAHFVLRVSNLQDSIDWYTTVLSMKVVHQNPFLAFMTFDEEHHRLALVQIKNDDSITQETRLTLPGLDHVAYTIESLHDLLSIYKRLKQQDIVPVWPINHGLTTSLYYADPDGNRVEFQVENFETKEELNAFMQSESFAANPIGVDFDPDTLLARFENGDPIHELLQQGSA